MIDSSFTLQYHTINADHSISSSCDLHVDLGHAMNAAFVMADAIYVQGIISSKQHWKSTSAISQYIKLLTSALVGPCFDCTMSVQEATFGINSIKTLKQLIYRVVVYYIS